MNKAFKGALICLMALMLLFVSCSKEEETPAETSPVKTEAVEAVKPVEGEKKTEPVVEAETAPVTGTVDYAPAIPTEMKTDLDRFAYSYGWGLMEAILSQDLIPNGQYFARGVMDCANMEPDLLVPVENIMTVLQTFLSGFEGGGDRGEYAELEDIMALPAPATAEEEFAYCYGFYNAFGILQQMIEIDGAWFPRGALDRLFEREGLLTEEEIADEVNSYFEEKEREYREWLEETAANNLQLAERMLAAKKAEEGNIVLSEKLVLEPIEMAAAETVHAEYEDSVTVNYTLRDIHGNIMDQGEGITFPVSGVIPGFGEACMYMSVGDHVYAYVHPAIGYGEYGTGSIAPNSLLVFEIELLDILAEA